MHFVFDRRVFRRQAEGVPPDRMQDVFALHPVVARDHIAQRIVAYMAHVQVTGGVRKHLEAVIARAFIRSRVGGREGFTLHPLRLPLGFYGFRIVDVSS